MPAHVIAMVVAGCVVALCIVCTAARSIRRKQRAALGNAHRSDEGLKLRDLSPHANGHHGANRISMMDNELHPGAQLQKASSGDNTAADYEETDYADYQDGGLGARGSEAYVPDVGPRKVGPAAGNSTANNRGGGPGVLADYGEPLTQAGEGAAAAGREFVVVQYGVPLTTPTIDEYGVPLTTPTVDEYGVPLTTPTQGVQYAVPMEGGPDYVQPAKLDTYAVPGHRGKLKGSGGREGVDYRVCVYSSSA